MTSERINAQRVLGFAVAWALLTTTAASAQSVDAMLDNGAIRVGVSRAFGGAIVWLSTNGGGNLVNVADKGRQVQQSYYAGANLTGIDQCASWSPWPWNPVQAGDCAGYTSDVLTLTNTGDQLYVKTRPKLWDRANRTAQCLMEQWLTFHPTLSDVVVVDNKLTCFRDASDAWGNPTLRDQEIPACYFVACLGTIKAYTGAAPWTSQPLATVPATFPWTRFTATEKWAACVNAADWGVGIYSATALACLGGKAGSGTTCNPFSSSTMYLSPLDRQALGQGSVYSYRYCLTVGSLSVIRSNVYHLRSNPAAPRAPQDLSATEGNAQVGLSWSPSPDAATYSVKRAITSGGPYTEVATGLPAPSHLDPNRVNGVPYYYVVSARNASGESPDSAEASATPTGAIINVPNSGFEMPPTPTFQYGPAGGSWTFTSGSGISGNGSAFTANNPPAPQGTQVAFLQSAGVVSQPLTGFVAGLPYTLTFSAAQRNFTQPGQTWRVTLDGALLASFSPAQSATDYADYAVTFSTTAGSHTLAFAGSNLNGGDNTVFIDRIELRIAVPSLQATFLSNGRVRLSWPAGASGLRVERATGLPPTSWERVTNQVVVLGTNRTVSVSTEGGQQFFRLRN